MILKHTKTLKIIFLASISILMISLISGLVFVQFFFLRTQDENRDEMLVFSLRLGGNEDERVSDGTLDQEGNILITGWTESSDFPLVNSQSNCEGIGIIIAKVTQNGSLIWSHCLGDGEGRAVAVDSQNNIVVSIKRTIDYYKVISVKKLNVQGNLIWQILLNGTESVGNIVIDSEDHIIIAGSTSSSDFPTLNAYDDSNNGVDAFVMKLAANGTLLWSTYLGGDKWDVGTGVIINHQDQIIITGYTHSSDFPTLNAYDANISTQDTIQPKEDVFITKFAPNGTLIWSSYVGGDDGDRALAIAGDSQDNIIITGHTESYDFPASETYDNTFNGVLDAFVVKFDTNGSLVWGTYLGGDGYEEGAAIAVDSQDNILLTGQVTSHNFPLVNPYDSRIANQQRWFNDAFIAKFTYAGVLIWSTYLGGGDYDCTLDIISGNQDNIIVIGWTGSLNFPVTDKKTSGYGSDAFITCFISSIDRIKR